MARFEGKDDRNSVSEPTNTLFEPKWMVADLEKVLVIQ
jgi:hypothetical protein